MRRRDRDGYSLLELTLSCTVLGVILAAAVPNLRSYRESQRIATESEQLAATVRAARARARSENHNVVIEYRPTTNTFAVIDDEDNSGGASAAETVLLNPLPAGLTLKSSTFPNDRLVFDRRGHAVSGGDVVIGGGRNVKSRVVHISPGTGQVKVQASSNS